MYRSKQDIAKSINEREERYIELYFESDCFILMMREVYCLYSVCYVIRKYWI